MYSLRPTPRGLKVSKTFASKSGPETVLHTCFVGANRFVTCGTNNVTFWTVPEGETTYKSQKGLFGKVAKQQTCLTVSAHPNNTGEVLTGTMSGLILIWAGRNCISTIKAHIGCINAMFVVPGVGLVTGGKDGRVQLWNVKLQRGADFELSNYGSLLPCVRSVCWIPEAHKLLIGTQAAEVLELSDTDGNNLNPGPLVQGHYGTGEVCGQWSSYFKKEGTSY